jgi:hypothetical protein
MKKSLIIFLTLLASTQLFAQHEARFGLFTGVQNTTLYNKPDADYGDYLPTFKAVGGLEAGYYFTAFKFMPMGISLQFSHAGMGQNYYGIYQDSSSYYGYTRLRYNRAGIAYHFSTNMRRKFAFNMSFGGQFAFLASARDRYEHIRNDNTRFVLDVKNQDVTWNDTTKLVARLKSPLYYKTDNGLFATAGFDVKMSDKFVFGMYARYDMGFESIENRDVNYITFATTPSTPAQPFFASYSIVKYRGPIADGPFRSATNTQAIGVFASIKYRMYNPEKVKWYYKP